MRAKVDLKRKYTATDIVRERLLPWARTSRTVTKILESGALRAKKEGEGTQRRYVVRGSDLKEYITQHGPALMHTARKERIT